MTLPEKIFALRRLPLLADLSDGELAVLAEASVERRFAAGETVCAAGRPPAGLLFVCAGAVTDGDGVEAGGAAGAAALLFDRPPDAGLVAGPAGAQCLQIARSDFFTLVRQCPAIVVGLLVAAPPP